ncbi:MAG: hypothetical protein ACE37I_04360 [Rubinisphaera brasiliensis]|uniref:hypothetical protein n=1 Tax=Rubinisphaera brasiliensis TaxID=119 RepID=UPI00391CE453
MSLKATWKCLLPFSLLLGVVLFSMNGRQTQRAISQETEPPKPTPKYDYWQRIQDEVDDLPNESFEESVALLASLDLYLHDHFGKNQGRTEEDVLAPVWEQVPVRRTLSNSRFLKVLQQSDEAPGRIAHLKDKLARALEEYEKRYTKTWEMYLERHRKRPHSSSWAFPGADNGCDPLKNPTLPGQRLQVFSLLLACSMSPDKEAAALCEKAIDIAFKQRKILLDPGFPLGLKSIFATRASLFNRRILATCLVRSKGIEVEENFWDDQIVKTYGAMRLSWQTGNVRLDKTEYPVVESHLKIATELSDDEFLKLLHESGYQQKN